MLQAVGLKLTTYGLQAIMNDLLFNTTGSAYSGVLSKLYLGLFTAYPGWSLGLLASQLTEANYGGYVRVQATWSAQGIDPTGRVEVFSQAVLWNPTNSSASNTIIGVALYDALTNGGLYGIGLLPNAVTLANPTTMMTLTARVAMPLDNADWGQSSATN